MRRFEGEAGSSAQTMSTNPASATAAQFLAPPETLVETPGEGEAFALGPHQAKSVLVILRVTEIVEQESLHVAVWGSADGKEWGAKPLFWFPQIFYEGVTPAALDLRQRPEIKFLQARWEVNRWGRGYPRPHFKLSVEIQELAEGH
jgi:hypothetical protein